MELIEVAKLKEAPKPTLQERRLEQFVVPANGTMGSEKSRFLPLLVALRPAFVVKQGCCNQVEYCGAGNGAQVEEDQLGVRLRIHLIDKAGLQHGMRAD